MAGTFTISTQEAQGLVAIPADLDALAVVVGCTSAGSGLSPFYASGQSAVTGVGYGDAVDTLTQIIEQRAANSKKYPAAIYTVPATTPGSYGTIDNTGVLGTALASADATSVPYGTYEVRIKIITGGTVGVAGITFQWSLDGGRNYSVTTALGTADRYLIPNSNVRIIFTPSATDLTALNTLLNQIKTKFNAHVVLTTGTVHSNADNADVVATTNASSTATRVALANALKVAYEAHRVLGSGASPSAIHINVSGDTVDTIVAANATDDESALTLALDLKAKINLHEAGTTWHTIADATNTITSAAPAVGTLLAGDIAKVRTFAGAPIGSDIDTAATALANSSADFALVVFDFDMSATLAAHVTSFLDTCKTRGKLVTALVRTRIPTFESSESDATWNTSIAADWSTFTDSRICKRAAYEFITDAMTTRQYLRSDLAQFAADVVRTPRGEWPSCPNDQKIPNATLVDSTGATIGHDEGSRGASTGLSDDNLGNTFSCVQRLDDFQRREDLYNTVPWVAYASGERIRNLMTRRLANAIERTVNSAEISKLGAKLFYTPTGSGTGLLTSASRKLVQSVVFNAVSSAFASEIGNAQDAALDTGLVQVSPAVTVSGGNLISISVITAPLVGGFLLSIANTLAVQE
jgi:hypothetical protein